MRHIICLIRMTHSRWVTDHESWLNIYDSYNSFSYSCDVCGALFSSAAVLQSHMLNHNPESANKFPCDVCGKTFATEARFKNHKKESHEKTYECPLCPEKFKRSINVDSHLGKFYKIRVTFICSQYVGFFALVNKFAETLAIYYG